MVRKNWRKKETSLNHTEILEIILWNFKQERANEILINIFNFKILQLDQIFYQFGL